MEPETKKTFTNLLGKSVAKSLWRQQTNALEKYDVCRLKKRTNSCRSHRMLLEIVYLPTFVGQFFLVNLVGKYVNIPVPMDPVGIRFVKKLKTTEDIGMPLRGIGGSLSNNEILMIHVSQCWDF